MEAVVPLKALWRLKRHSAVARVIAIGRRRSQLDRASGMGADEVVLERDFKEYLEKLEHDGGGTITGHSSQVRCTRPSRSFRCWTQIGTS